MNRALQSSNRGSARLLVPAALLAAILLFVSLRGVNWLDLLSTVLRARWPFLVLALGLVNTSFFLRAVRWRVLLRPKYPVSYRIVFGAMAQGYLANSLLPARAGDVIRAASIKRKTSEAPPRSTEKGPVHRPATISFSYALASTLVERLTDMAALVLIGLVSVALSRGLAPWIIHTTWVMAGLAAAGIVALFSLPRLEPMLASAIARTRISWLASSGPGTVVREFLDGLRALQDPTRALQFGGITSLIWLIDAFATIAVALSLQLSLSLEHALLLLAALGLSSAIPSTPGYIGIYQFVAVTVLIPLGYTRNHAIAFIFLYQGIMYCMILFWGAVFSWRSALLWCRALRKQPPHPERSSALEVLPRHG